MKWIVYLTQKGSKIPIARFRYREDAQEFCSNKEYNLLEVHIEENECAV